MKKVMSPMTEGFSPENADRIHRGQAALADGSEARDVLSPHEFEALFYAAHGLTRKQTAERMDVPANTIMQHMVKGKRLLGVATRAQIAGYFPLRAEHPLIEGKKFADLGRSSKQLEVLEDLSMGLTMGQIAELQGSALATPRVHLRRVGETWTDARGMLLSIGVANAIRARYVGVVEADSSAMERGLLGGLTLPELKEAEPDILSLIEIEE